VAQRDRSEYFYHPSRTHLVFGAVTLMFIGVMVLMAYDDYAREWKHYQLAFRELEVSKTRQQLADARSKSQGEIDKAEQAAVDSEKALEAKQDDIEKLRETAKTLRAKSDRARMDFQFRKADQDVEKYHYEHLASEGEVHGDHGHEADHAAHGQGRHEKMVNDAKKKYDEVTADVDRLYQKYMEAESEAVQASEAVATATSVLEEARRSVKRATGDVDRLGRKLKSIQKNLINDAFRNLPILDFINPNLTIKQFIIEDIREDLHFTDVRKIDRCTTCHIAIDKPGYEDAPQPLTTHPNLDLYVTDNSKHPMNLMGCTVCHEGNGIATDFNRAAHNPRDHEQELEWKQEYGWEVLHHWDYPMHKKGNVESSCLKCHDDPEEIPEAQTLLAGHTLFLQRGCYSCHSIDKPPYQNLPKQGPTLEHLAEKLTPEFIVRWLADPWSFRKDSKMPRLFYLENSDTEADKDKDAVVIEGITRYLLSTSTASGAQLEAPADDGDAAAGRDMVKSVGCMACHTIDDIAKDFTEDPLYVQSSMGPNLSNVGTKLNKKWLFNWLKNPHAYHATTYMPSLRLTDDEANNVAAYLLSLKDEAYLSTPVREAKVSALDEVMAEQWASKMPRSEAVAKLATMSEDEKFIQLGKDAITSRNCYSCHSVAGFDKMNPVVLNFTEQGSKDVDQLNWGFIPYHHPTQEQIDNAHHAGEPLNGFHHYVHKPEDRFVQETPKGGRGLSGAATLRYPEVYGNKNVPYPTDSDNATPSVADTFVAHGERTDWFFNQVKNPQLWDRGVEKGYWDKSRMPQFGLTDEQAHAVAVFVSAQKKQSVRGALANTMSARDQALADGRAVFKRYNCMACHTIGLYEDQITFSVAPGVDRYTDGAQPSVDLERERLWMAHPAIGKAEIFGEDEKPTGTFKPEPVTVFAKNAWLAGNVWDPEFQSNVPVATWAAYFFLDTARVFGKHEGWMRQYYASLPLAPPMLYRQGEKTRPEWLFEWLNNVHTIRPGLQVRMPQYNFTEAEATAIVKFFAYNDHQPWPFEDAPPAPGDAPVGDNAFFNILQCNSCHPSGHQMPTGNDQSAWGPNIALSPARLKDSWLQLWLKNPAGFYPGTMMPNNFFLAEEGTYKPLLGTDDEMHKMINDVIAWMHVLDPRQAVLDYHNLPAVAPTVVSGETPAEGQAAPPPAASEPAGGENPYE